MSGKLSNIVLKNQYGEVFNNFIKSGSASNLWCNFVVDSTNGNGLGIRSLKSSGPTANPEIANVYMYTSSTPATGNPNPVSGLILVKFAAAYAGYMFGSFGVGAPTSGSNINITSGLSVGTAYTIVSVGTSTAANWQALGLPTTTTPNVGVTFICTSATAGTGTGIVQVVATNGSGVTHAELVGDPNQTCNASSGGGYLVTACFGQGALTMNSYTPAGTNNSASPPIFTGTPATLTGSISGGILTAPANNTVIGLNFTMIHNRCCIDLRRWPSLNKYFVISEAIGEHARNPRRVSIMSRCSHRANGCDGIWRRGDTA